MKKNVVKVLRFSPKTGFDQLRKTIQLIGAGIRAASVYWPLRDHAARIATTARPKDYLGQLSALYDDFTKRRWRYVKDPVYAEQVPITGPVVWNIVCNGDGNKGREDCDGATVAFGALASSIGFPVRIVTSTPPGATVPKHVYPEVFIFGVWVPADPVLYPLKGLGQQCDAIRRDYFDLFGKYLGTKKTKKLFLMKISNSKKKKQNKKEKIKCRNVFYSGTITGSKTSD